MNISTQGWNDFLGSQPIDPRSFLASAQLGANLGIFKRSTTCLQSTWGTNTANFTGNNTTLQSLDTTDALTATYAGQWVFKTKMVNVAATINSSVSKIAFGKAGLGWDNQYEINFGATNYTDAQLTARDNLGTLGIFAGSATGAIPVFSFPGTQTGPLVLHLTFSAAGTYSTVLVISNAGTYSTFEMEFVVV